MKLADDCFWHNPDRPRSPRSGRYRAINAPRECLLSWDFPHRRPLLQRDFPEKRLSEFRSLRKSKKIRRSEAIRLSLSARSRSGRDEAIVSDPPPTAPRMLAAMRGTTRWRLDASPPSPKHSHEIATTCRKHETEGHGGQVTNDPAGHLARCADRIESATK
jgi:hypothetical protein